MPAKQGGPGEGQDEGIENQTVASFDPLSPALLCPRSRVLPEGEGVYGTAVTSDTREAIMSKNISIALGDHFQKFVQELVSQGRFGSTSEIIRAGLRLLEEQDTRLAALRRAIQEGLDSGPAEPFDFNGYASTREGNLKRG